AYIGNSSSLEIGSAGQLTTGQTISLTMGSNSWTALMSANTLQINGDITVHDDSRSSTLYLLSHSTVIVGNPDSVTSNPRITSDSNIDVRAAAVTISPYTAMNSNYGNVFLSAVSANTVGNNVTIDTPEGNIVLLSHDVETGTISIGA